MVECTRFLNMSDEDFIKYLDLMYLEGFCDSVSSSDQYEWEEPKVSKDLSAKLNDRNKHTELEEQFWRGYSA